MRGLVARRAIPLLLLTACSPPSPAHAAETRAADARHVVAVGRLDIEGGGMVDVQGNLAAIGHMAPLDAAWFARGLRVLDIGVPSRPTKIAHYVPRRPDGRPPLSNDVFVDRRGLIYLIDRDAGLDILRLTGAESAPPGGSAHPAHSP